MAEKIAKLENTKFIEVVVTNRNTESETRSTFVGGNNIVIDGSKEIKHYTVQLEEKVSLPEPFVKQLEDRAYIIRGKDGKEKSIKIFVVERV